MPNFAQEKPGLPIKRDFTVSRDKNRISISGYLSSSNIRRVLAAMHNTIQDRGYSDIILDFSDCSRAGPGAMLGIAAQCQRLLHEGVDTFLELPKNMTLSRLFRNANWAHLIDFRQFEESQYRGHENIPALRYRDGNEQYEAVSRILDVLLGALTSIDRSHVRAIEWSLNEITDNVINHAQSPTGGLVQLTNFPRSQSIQITVCDAGVGIPNTLRVGHPEITSDQEALDRAIREGITRDKAIGQGNGLYGSWRVARLSGGSFFINSGYASLISTDKIQLHVGPQPIPFTGSLVTLRVTYSKNISLEEALKFKGSIHKPIDHIELKYEQDDSGNIAFNLKSEARGLGTRSAGVPIRQKLQNLNNMIPDRPIVIDFESIDLVSSSFADEVFGKLFSEMGAMTFSGTFRFINIDPLVKALIDRAISQRIVADSGH